MPATHLAVRNHDSLLADNVLHGGVSTGGKPAEVRGGRLQQRSLALALELVPGPFDEVLHQGEDSPPTPKLSGFLLPLADLRPDLRDGVLLLDHSPVALDAADLIEYFVTLTIGGLDIRFQYPQARLQVLIGGRLESLDIPRCRVAEQLRVAFLELRKPALQLAPLLDLLTQLAERVLIGRARLTEEALPLFVDLR